MLRKTFKTAQKHFEREQGVVMTSIKDAAKAATMGGASAEDSIKSLEQVIQRMQGYKRKVEALHEEEKILHGHERKRIAHLQDLYDVPCLVDPRYDRWSRIRLDRLLVDFLLRSGYGETARRLAEEKGIMVSCSDGRRVEGRLIISIGIGGCRCICAVLKNRAEFEEREYD